MSLGLFGFGFFWLTRQSSVLHLEEKNENRIF